MAAANDTTEVRTRRTYTDKERRAFLKRLKDKPEHQTVKALCEELGIGQPILYYWRSRYEQGQPFAEKSGRKKPSTAIEVRAADDSRQLEIPATRRTPVHVEIQAQAPLTMSEREELAVLRAEVKRYRRMLFASMTEAP